jgi:hypothetical protein
MSKKLKNVTKTAEKNVAEKNLGGRPPIVFTDEQLAELEEVAPYLNYLQTADYFKISHNTFFEMLKRDERFMVAYKKAKAAKLKILGAKLLDKALGKAPEADTGAIVFYLKTQGRWKENHDQPEVNVNINTLTDNQRRQKEIDIKLYDKYRRDMGFGMDSETAIDAEFVVEETKLLKDDEN